MNECDEVGWGGVFEPRETIPCECAGCGVVLGLGLDGQDGVMVISDIREERGQYYGDVQRNHESIGLIWTGILGQAVMSGRWAHGEPIPPEIVCLMMVGVKLSREAYRHKDDNILDAKNYIDFASELSSDRG